MRDAAGAGARYADAEPFEPMVQELIPGGDEELYTVGSYIAADGAVSRSSAAGSSGSLRPASAHAALARHCGCRRTSTLRCACSAPSTSTASRRWSSTRPARRPLKLMEVNPRLWLWHGLAASLGVDFARIAYLDLLGRRGAPVTTEGRHGRWAITLLAGESPALQRPPYVEPVFSLDDLRPGATQLARVVKAALS